MKELNTQQQQQNQHSLIKHYQHNDVMLEVCLSYKQKFDVCVRWYFISVHAAGHLTRLRRLQVRMRFREKELAKAV